MPDRPVNAGWFADQLAQLTGGHRFLMILETKKVSSDGLRSAT